MPMVGIVMGSDSDLRVMSSAAAMLEELGIEYEMRIISAHREPDLLIEWTRTAKDRGIKVMIAGAGMAAACKQYRIKAQARLQLRMGNHT